MLPHRRIGVAVALLALLLASTGIALSHAVALRLNERMFDASWLLALYRIEPVSPPRAMHSAAGWLIWIDNHLYLDGKPVADDLATPLGAAENGDVIAIANNDAVLLLTLNGQLLERLDRSSLPGPIDAIGNDALGAIAVRSEGRVLISAELLRRRRRVGVAGDRRPAQRPVPRPHRPVADGRQRHCHDPAGRLRPVDVVETAAASPPVAGTLNFDAPATLSACGASCRV